MNFEAGDPGTVVVAITLDLLFLDVTAHVSSIGNYQEFLQGKAALNIKSNTAVLEFTGGKPAAWPVILPTSLSPSRNDINVLLVLKNEALDRVDDRNNVVNGIYSNADDANYVRALTPYWGRCQPSR